MSVLDIYKGLLSKRKKRLKIFKVKCKQRRNTYDHTQSGTDVNYKTCLCYPILHDRQTLSISLYTDQNNKPQ